MEIIVDILASGTLDGIPQPSPEEFLSIGVISPLYVDFLLY